MGFQLLAKCRQRVSRRHIGRQVLTNSWADSRESPVGYSRLHNHAGDVDVVGRDEAVLTINVSCVAYDSQSGIVTALVTWQLPASAATKTGRATWNSTVLVQYHTPDGPHMNAHRTTSHDIQLTLPVDYLYEITVRHRSCNK